MEWAWDTILHSPSGSLTLSVILPHDVGITCGKLSLTGKNHISIWCVGGLGAILLGVLGGNCALGKLHGFNGNLRVNYSKYRFRDKCFSVSRGSYD